MAEMKYKYNSSLKDYDLCVGIFDSFHLQVSDLIPLRNAFLLRTDKGDKILKKIEFIQEELIYISSAVNHIKKSFLRIVDYLETKEKSILLKYGKNLYCIIDMIQAGECDFSNPGDIEIAAKGLGELHKASAGFSFNSNLRYNNGRLINFIKRKKEELELFKPIAQMDENKSQFDEIFMENADYYIEKADKCLGILNGSSYLKLCDEEDKVALCHNDLSCHNILIQDEEAYFMDFNSAAADLKVNDLCNFINNVRRNQSLDMEKTGLILQAYCKSNSLDSREMEILYSLLMFPEDFYKISKDYYCKRDRWHEEVFVEKLKRRVVKEEETEEFLNSFEKLTTDHHAGINISD